MYARFLSRSIVLFLSSLLIFSCGSDNNGESEVEAPPPPPQTDVPTGDTPAPEPPSPPATTYADRCEEVRGAPGTSGDASGIRAEVVVSGVSVPWGITFIGERDFLFTERSGEVRLYRDGGLVQDPVLRLENVASRNEGGLLGIAVHPEFATNRLYYIYYTARTRDGDTNRVARYRLAEDGRSSQFDRVVIDGIPAGLFHDGGRIRFGPDGFLYIGTGDARRPNLSQDPDSLAGKILRLTPDGDIPSDNPIPGSPVYVLGVRNVQAFDWIDRETLVVADHGPTGEMGRRGADKVSFARAGDNLGWPEQWRCESVEGRRRPFLVWDRAVPPGGLVYFTGRFIPEWNNSVIVATLGSRHLHRITFETVNGEVRMAGHEVFFDGTYGRLREAIQAPDGSLYITTSNCDGRGTCGPERDRILRVTKD